MALYQLSYAKLAPHGGARTHDHLVTSDELAIYAACGTNSLDKSDA